MAETIRSLLERAAGVPEIGLRFLDRRERPTFFAWNELRRRAQQVAGSLAELGIRRGQRVVLIFPTGVEFFDAFFGTLLAGGVPVPLYPPVRLGRLDEYHLRTARMIEAAGARLVLSDRRVRRLLGQAVAAARPPLGCLTLADLPPAAPTEVELADDDLALVQFSSGTTVAPKPVALTQRAILAQTALLNGFWPDSTELRHAGVSWLPLYHDMGLIGCVFPALERPAMLTLIGPELFVARPAVWLRALSRYEATVSPAPNFAYGLCVAKVRDEELEGVDLSNWRVALNGAEAVAPGVLRAFQRRFAPFGLRPEALTPVYGLSEAALAVTFSDLHGPFTTCRFDRQRLAGEGRAVETDDGAELVSVGRPLPGFALRLVDEEGTEVGEGQVGRIWIRGPSLMAGYLDDAEATARALRDGWLDSGDLGFLHRGELYLTGRAKDVVILHGRNYPPEAIEHTLDGVAGLRTGCAVAVGWLPEGAGEEQLWLFVEQAREATDDEIETLPAACREAVRSGMGLSVEEVLVLEPGTLPRTSSGKLRRGETLRLHKAGELVPPAPVNALRLAGAVARSQLAFARLRRDGGER